MVRSLADRTFQLRSVAVGMFSTVILVPFVFTLIQQGGVVSELMWQFIDMFVSVFLAILWFGAFSDFLTLDAVLKFLSGNTIVVACAQVQKKNGGDRTVKIRRKI